MSKIEMNTSSQANSLKARSLLKDKLMGHNFLLFITVVLFILMYAAGIVAFHEKNFGTWQVFLNLFISNAGLIITSMGMTMVLIIAGIDISVGSMVAVVCMGLSVMMETAMMNPFLAILIVLVFGAIYGAFQGWLISYLRLEPFIITLTGMFLLRGLTAMISLNMVTVTNQTFLDIAQSKIYMPFLGVTTNAKGATMAPYIYPTVILALLVFVIVLIVLRYTKFGRSVYAVGGNQQSAMLMGLNVKRIKLKVYMVNGFLAALGGVAYLLNTCGAFVELAKDFEMEAIAATVIGGTPLTGGVGNAFGTLIGVLTKATIETFVSFQGNISSWWSKIIIAALLAVFIIIQSLLARRKQKQ